MQVMQCNMEEGDIQWFLKGKLNVSGEHYGTHISNNIYP